MASKKITELPLITGISGSVGYGVLDYRSVIPVVVGGSTNQITVEDFSIYAVRHSATTQSNTFLGNQTITGNISVSGTSTLTGNTSVGGTLGVTGNTALSGDASVGGNLVVAGRITAEEFHTEITTASVIYASGSTKFGDTIDDKHEITGSTDISGSLIVRGNVLLNGTTFDISQLNLYTQSLKNEVGTIEAYTASVKETISQTLTYTQSLKETISQTLAYTASVKETISQTLAYTGSVKQTISQTLAYTASLKGAVLPNGTNLDVFGNLRVSGSTYFGDNASDLTIVTGNVQVTGSVSSTGGNTADFVQLSLTPSGVSGTGKLIWDSVTNGIIVGGNITATGFTGSFKSTNGVVSASAQITELPSIQQATASLAAFTGSIRAELGNVEAYTASVKETITQTLAYTASVKETISQTLAYTASVKSEIGDIEAYTASLKETITQTLAYTGSVKEIISQTLAYTASVKSEIGNIESYTASVKETITQTLAYTGSVKETISQTLAYTASVKNEVGGLEAYTASLKGAIVVSGNNIEVLGTLSAQQIHTTYTTSSVLYQSGSTKFGDTADDTHQFTGSLNVSNGIFGTINASNGVVSGSSQITELAQIAPIQAYTASLKTSQLLSGSGLTNYVPIYNGTTALSSSIIFQSTGSIAGVGKSITIGSDVAMYKFAVNPIANTYFGIGYTDTDSVFMTSVDNTYLPKPIVYSAQSYKWYATSLTSTYELGMIIQSSSLNVGFGGITNPLHKVDISGSARVSNGLTVSGSLNVYQPLTNTTSYLTIKNNRARNAAVYTETTNGGFYAGTSIGTDTFNYQIYDAVAGVPRITISSDGNFGFGITPSSWGGGWTALQVGARSSFYSDSPKNTLMGNNLFYDGVDNKYIESAAAARFYIETSGGFIWQQAPSGTAGNAITFTPTMVLTSDGYFGIGKNSATVSSGDLIGLLAFKSNDTSTNSAGAIASIRSYATADYNTGNVEGDMRFYTSPGSAPNGSLLSGTEYMRLGKAGGLIIATNNSGTIRSSIGEGTLELVRDSSNTVQAGSYLQFTDPTNTRYWVLQQDASYNWATWHYNAGWSKVGYQTPAGTWTNSDIRRKKDFESVNYGLSEVLQLNPQKFRFTKQTNNEQKSLGFIAQEVLPIIPEAVQSDMDGDEQYYAMNYSNLVPVLTKAIQEQQAIIDGLIARIEALENK